MLRATPLDPFIKKHGMLMLDGGLATELEKMGYNIKTPLWSAELLDSNPEAIKKVHLSYLKAGADCIISSSYQASIPGFVKNGYTVKKAATLLARSVEIANEACDEYIAELKNKKNNFLQPLVAASIGPFGAFLSDGSEYWGNYKVPKSHIKSYHESRLEVLCNTSVNVLACETIPSFEEAEVLIEILNQTPDILIWISFSCRDGERISDGTKIKNCAKLLKDHDRVIAIGINCTAPKYISSLIKQVKQVAPGKPVAVYPNSGKIYNIQKQSWKGNSDSINFSIAACDWFKDGARLIGGCCQVGPTHINAMKTTLINQQLYKA